METVMAFAPLMGYWIAAHGSYVVICLALFVYRARRWPSFDPFLALAASGALFWFAPQQPHAVFAGLFLFVAGWGAFIAGGLAGAELRGLSNTNPDSSVAKHS